MERSGIAVYDEPLAFQSAFNPILQLNLLGYRTKTGLCLAEADISVSYIAAERLGSLAHTGAIFAVSAQNIIWASSYVFSGPENLNQQAMEIAQEWADTLTADIAKARRVAAVQQLIAVWNTDPPMTKAALDRQVEEFLKEINAETAR